MSAPDLLDFLQASPTPYHAVDEFRRRLIVAGYHQIHESEDWSTLCRPGCKFFVIREASSIVAFTIGLCWKPGEPIGIVAAHTDSPCLKLKPRSKDDGHGALRAAVETYGKGIWQTWFDRDLSVAGRIVLKSEYQPIQERLFSLERPICRIPSLARFLMGSESWPAINKQTHLRPILSVSSSNEPLSQTAQPSSSMLESDRYHDELLGLIAEASAVPKQDILECEAILHDLQPPAIGGLSNEFIFGSRLDNLYMSYCAIMALLQASCSATAATIQLVSLFDHEEIGSKTTQGAQSDFLPSVIRRLSSLKFDTAKSMSTTAYEQTLAKSFLISADMAHGLNANYAEKSDELHAPLLNRGVAIKVNANMKYATSTPGLALIRLMASERRVPLQLFTVDNNCPCGSTIGPMLASLLGVRGIDVGVAQWSMHSIRETAGTKDVGYAVDLFRTFFEEFEGI